MALWSTIPFGLIPVTFTASVNISVRTPELALKEKDISSGSVTSGLTELACNASEESTATSKLPATSRKASGAKTI